MGKLLNSLKLLLFVNPFVLFKAEESDIVVAGKGKGSMVGTGGGVCLGALTDGFRAKGLLKLSSENGSADPFLLLELEEKGSIDPFLLLVAAVVVALLLLLLFLFSNGSVALVFGRWASRNLFSSSVSTLSFKNAFESLRNSYYNC